MTKHFHFLNLDLPIADNMLLSFLKAKDEKAFQYLYDNYAPLLYGQILKDTGNSISAEQALNNTFKTIWQTVDQFDASRQRLLIWMLNIARRCSSELQNSSSVEPKNKPQYSNAI